MVLKGISAAKGVIRCVKLVQSPEAEREGHRDGEEEEREGGELWDSQGRAPSLSMSTSFSQCLGSTVPGVP